MITDDICLCSSPFTYVDPVTGSHAQFGCGRCPYCIKKRKNAWRRRISDEAKVTEKTCFLTLTYDDDHLPARNSLCRSDVTKFFKRLRKKHSFRYFFCGEYGDTFGRPHYHLIMFGLDCMSPCFKTKTQLKAGWRCYMDEWPFGFCHVAPCTEADIAYVAGYVEKKCGDVDYEKEYDDKGLVRPFIGMSTSPGIGAPFIRRYGPEFIENVDKEGRKLSDYLPRYYRRLCFSRKKWHPDAIYSKYLRYSFSDIENIREVVQSNIESKQKLYVSNHKRTKGA